MSIEFNEKFVAAVDDGEERIISASGCNSSVSVSLDDHTVHIPWIVIAGWIGQLCKQAEAEE